MKPKNPGALLITLLVLVLIVILAMEIFHVGARAAQTGAHGRDSVRGSLLAEAGLAAARIALRESAKDYKYDTLDQVWSRPVPPIELGEGTILVTVEDEDRKINLNRLVLPNGNAPDEQRLAVFRKLLANLDIDPSIADAVVDWIDNDDTPRVGGAESSYYLSLPYPYRAKNDLFDTLDELRLIRGMTPERFEKAGLRDDLFLGKSEHQHRSEGGPDGALCGAGRGGRRGNRRLRRRSDHRIQEGQRVPQRPGHRQRQPRPEGPLQQDEVPRSYRRQRNRLPRPLDGKRLWDLPDDRRRGAAIRK
jgi:hypothetical protein